MADLPGTGRKIKRFKVAREGQTRDQRTLTRQDLQELADTYNPDVYGARINIEHIAGYSPNPPFNAHGDVILLDTVEEGGKLCLYATISALPQLVEMNAQGQKIYPSIEVISNFGGTGKLYLSGLALTDVPAVIGTQPLKFSYANTEYKPDRTIPADDIFWTFSTIQPQDSSLSQRLKDFFSGRDTKQVQQQHDLSSQIGDLKEGILLLAAGITQQFNALRPQSNAANAQPAPNLAQPDLALLNQIEQLLQQQNSGYSSNSQAPVEQRLQQVLSFFKQLEQTPQAILPPGGQSNSQQADF